jgi:hypothetical protein
MTKIFGTLKPKREIKTVAIKMYDSEELAWRKLKVLVSNGEDLDEEDVFQHIMQHLRGQKELVRLDDVPLESLPVKATRRRKQRSGETKSDS